MAAPPFPHPNCDTIRIFHEQCGHVIYIKRIDSELHNAPDQGPPEVCVFGHYHNKISPAAVCERCKLMIERSAVNWGEATGMVLNNITERFVRREPNDTTVIFQFHPDDTEHLDPQLIIDRRLQFRTFRILSIIRPVVGTPSEEKCSICLCEWEDQRGSQGPERPFKLPCQHEYGMNCIITWLMERDTCPQCREQVV